MDNSTGHSDPFAFLIPMLLGAIFLTSGVWNLRRTRHLRRTGATAYGQVVRHNLASSSRSTYSPVVAWQTPDGRRREYSPGMHRSWKGRFKVGARVRIYYNPADPDQAVLDGYDGAVDAWVFVAAGVAAIIVGLFLLVTVPLGGSF